jgi:glycine/D-amino acid oxidase-like deaminating enzyme
MTEPHPTAWRHGAEETAPQVDGALRAQVDVAIVGAGYTGLSAALFCARAGLSVQVIEAADIGAGGSGQNVGLVNAGLWLPPAKVEAALGPELGPRFVKRFGDAPARVFDLIERYQIRCSATRTGTIHAAHNIRGMRGLRARHAAWHRLGAPVTLLTAAETARMTGSPGFAGGLLDERAGTINPLAYARGLARAARAAGATIATDTRVSGLSHGSEGWSVQTARGPITARAVVLATNAHTGRLWPAVTASLTPIHFVQAATEPLGATADAILPGGQGLWDTAPIMTSLRKDAAGRLIVGSMGRLLGSARQGATLRWARARLRRFFPDLPTVAIETAWDGRIAMTPDHIPRIHQLAPGLYAPTAYNGRGITTGTLFGEALAGLLSGAGPETLPIPLGSPVRDRLAPAKARIYDLAFSANQLWRGMG